MADLMPPSAPQGLTPFRDRLTLQVGAYVMQGEETFRIEQVLDFESAIGQNVVTGRSAPLRVGELLPVKADQNARSRTQTDLADIADEDWRVAQQRFAAIQPLVGKYTVGRTDAERVAQDAGVSVATLYRWMERYRKGGTVEALIPQKRGWRAGRIRLDSHANQILEDVIDDYYLTPNRQTVQKTIEEVGVRCHKRGIEAPSPATIRVRIGQIPDRDVLRRRGYREEARNKYHPVPGRFPNADFPLAVVQIDHTEFNIMVVDDLHRKPIGRPWITVALDVYSRMILGYYLSFDAPSITSTAMCLAHAMLPKEEWLLLHQVTAKWPVWGVPKTIHTDNAAEFRSHDLGRSCLNYGIHVEHRLAGLPNTGGHIERGIQTLLGETHSMPGTTFASASVRKGYDSEGRATMTLAELESYLVKWICTIYHAKIHSALSMTPLRKWDIGIFGSEDVVGIGLPPLPADRQTVVLDFLPSVLRTVQPDGVTISNLSYYADALRPWINATEPETGQKRKFVFRSDPRNVSEIWFFDPVLKQYFRVPLADPTFPAMSLWEHRQALDKLKADGLKHFSQDQVFVALIELREDVAKAAEKTKSARRKQQKGKEHRKQVSPAAPLAAEAGQNSGPAVEAEASLLTGDIQPYGVIG